jgi:hypothetical protein
LEQLSRVRQGVGRQGGAKRGDTGAKLCICLSLTAGCAKTGKLTLHTERRTKLRRLSPETTKDTGPTKGTRGTHRRSLSLRPLDQGLTDSLTTRPTLLNLRGTLLKLGLTLTRLNGLDRPVDSRTGTHGGSTGTDDTGISYNKSSGSRHSTSPSYIPFRLE